MFLRVSKYPPNVIFHNAKCNRLNELAQLGQTNLICCFSSAPASTSNTPLQLSLLPFASGTPPINAINNHVMSRETSLMASAHCHLNNEVMNNNRPPAPKFRKWLMRNNKSSLSGLMLNCLCRTRVRSPNAVALSSNYIEILN